MPDQPVRSDEASPRLQHAEHLSHQRVLVRDVDDAVLRKHDIKCARRKRQRTRHDLDRADARAQALAGDERTRAGQHRILDVDPGHVSRAVRSRQGDVDAAGAATDIQDRQPCQIRIGDQAGHFVGPTGRQEALAPNGLQHLDQLAVMELASLRCHRYTAGWSYRNLRNAMPAPIM